MKLKSLLALTVAFSLVSTAAQATVKLFFSFTNQHFASGFANAAGAPTNGMKWGIIIDTTGNGFLSGSYTPFSIASDEFLSTSGGLSDDYFFPSANLTTDTTGQTEFGTSFVGGPGTITSVGSVPFGSHSIDQNDPFAIVWFSPDADIDTASLGDKYGFLQNASVFKIPADGSDTDLSAPFAGTDAPRIANQTIVPEPSTWLLLVPAGMALILFGKVRRRALRG